MFVQFLFVHLWETWLGNHVSWFVHLWETWLGNNMLPDLSTFGNMARKQCFLVCPRWLGSNVPRVNILPS